MAKLTIPDLIQLLEHAAPDTTIEKMHIVLKVGRVRVILQERKPAMSPFRVKQDHKPARKIDTIKPPKGSK